MRKLTAVLTIVMVGAFVISGAVFAAGGGDEFVMGSETDARTLDPQKVHDHQSGLIGWNLYESLLEYDVSDYSIKPLLAVSWEVSQDLKSCTFQLRKGVKFHDGTPFNADAVAYSMERLLALGQTPASYLQTIKRWEVGVPYTIVFYNLTLTQNRVPRSK